MKITFQESGCCEQGALVLGVFEGSKLTPAAQSADERIDGALSRAIAENKFDGKNKETLVLLRGTPKGPSRIVLVGLGKEAEVKGKTIEEAAALAYKHVSQTADKSMMINFSELPDIGLSSDTIAAHAAFGVKLKSYKFNKYFTKKKADEIPGLDEVIVVTDSVGKTQVIFEEFNAVADGVFFARDLCTEAPNVLYPETFAAEAKHLEKLGVKIEVLNEKEMAKLGMNTLLSVGHGSEKESQLLVMQWLGGQKDDAPVAFVGKGITFDTGGISLKPPKNMHEMKFDMGGAAAVAGLMKAVAGRKAKANVVGVCALAENMVSGAATRPGDIVTSMSGQTVEILNTDAEGRLVLADALWYTQDRFKPKAVVNLATLTGAMIVALGHENAGLFSNDDTLSGHLTASGLQTDEAVWRMPLSRAYDKIMDSEIADMQNIGNGTAGSITAAQFLQRFIQKDVPWAHLDIAGTVWAYKEQPLCNKGATGFGVRLLNDYVKKNHEK